MSEYSDRQANKAKALRDQMLAMLRDKEPLIQSASTTGKADERTVRILANFALGEIYGSRAGVW